MSFVAFILDSWLRMSNPEFVVHFCNTPCYGSPNLSLITIIKGLVMHAATGLINSESSQRHFLIYFESESLNLNQ
jgi:hypothetical protein